MDNKIIKMAILNIVIVAVAVLAYSEGFLALRPGDASILRAGMAIFIAVAEVFAFFYGNYQLLSDRPRIAYDRETLTDLSQARAALHSFHGGRFFGRIADTSVEQLDRLGRTMERAERAIGMKFEQGSMTYDRYHSVVQAARDASLANCIALANRMQLFDESEYAKLQHYREDDIPDDIQEKQLALYKKNMDLIQSSVAANEHLILALDTMSVELTDPQNTDDDGDNAQILDEIAKLTEQVKLYT